MAGLADATMGAPPRDVQAIKQGRAMLLDLGQLDVPYFGAGMIVRDAYATANAALVERPTCAGSRRRTRSRRWRWRCWRSISAPTIRRRYAHRTMPTRRRGAATNWCLRPAIVAQLQASDRQAAKTAAPTDFYDNRYLERVKQSGYVDSLYAGRFEPCRPFLLVHRGG